MAQMTKVRFAAEADREQRLDTVLGRSFRDEVRREAAERRALRLARPVPQWLIQRRALIHQAKALAAQGRTVTIRNGELIVR